MSYYHYLIPNLFVILNNTRKLKFSFNLIIYKLKTKNRVADSDQGVFLSELDPVFEMRSNLFFAMILDPVHAHAQYKLSETKKTL